MKRRTILLLSVLGLIIFHTARHRQQATIGLDHSWAYSEQLLDLQIPDVVESHSSVLHVAVPSTGLSLVVPDAYEQRVDFRGYRKDKDSCINVREDLAAGLTVRRQEADAYISSLGQGQWRQERLMYRKDFKFNGYDAFIVCVSDTTNTRTAVYMAFGDEHFSVAMTGTMPDDSNAHRDEILSTMLTACYHKA